MKPVVLPANQPDTFYRGAGRIAAFRGDGAGPVAVDRPEDWIASTVSRFGEPRSGMTALPDGSSLCAAVEADPYRWLGPEAPAHAPSLAVPLVKYLDAGQRLPVHVHPDDAFARAHLGAHHGKTEAWLVMDAAPGACVFLGWRREVGPAELREMVLRQDVPAMLAAMNALGVRPGDTIVVPAGTVHAIGHDIFLTEVQQAADLSVLLEWEGFLPSSDGAFVGLELDAALACVDVAPLNSDLAADLVVQDAVGAWSGDAVAELLAPVADPYFRAQVLRGGAAVPAAYRTLVVLDGHGTMRDTAGSHTPLERGMTVAVPFAAGDIDVDGDVTVASFGPASTPS